MILQYVLILLAAIVLSALKFSIWITYLIIFTLFIVVKIILNPLYLSKDPEKMKAFLKKSKQPGLHIMYLMYDGKFAEAEALLPKIRSKSRRRYFELSLYVKQKKIPEARWILDEIVNPLGNYYRAILALYGSEAGKYEVYKKKVKNPIYRVWLQAEEERCNGNLQEALRLMDEQLPKLRGLRLLAAYEYRKELELDMLKPKLVK